jgi:hypothetical protein
VRDDLDERTRIPGEGAPGRIERERADLRRVPREQAARLIEVVHGHVDEERLVHLEPDAVEEGRAPKVDLDRLDAAEPSAADVLLNCPVAAAETVVLAHHEDAAGPLGALDQLAALADAGRERLLDETMHSGFQRFERQRSVHGWWRDDEHCVGLDPGARHAEGLEPARLVETDLVADARELLGVGVHEGDQIPVWGGRDLGGPARPPGAHADLDHPHAGESWP